MGILMHDWLLTIIAALDAGVTKRSISLNDDANTIVSYYEKGKFIPGQPSMIYIHGFSSNKEAWLSVLKFVPDSYHSILIDLPRHGETTDTNADDHSIHEVVDTLKLFFDTMQMTDPLCLIGASIGGTTVALFTVKYPEYVSMICLLAPPPTKLHESELIKKLHAGMDYILLPTTSEEFYATAELLTVKKVTAPKAFIDRYFKSRLRVVDQQRRILKAFLEYEYLNLEQYYDQLKFAKCPALILWGRQDQLCVVDAAYYFSNLLSDSEVTIFDECGHFVSFEKAEETAKYIMEFVDRHSYDVVELPPTKF
ncbi:unnamed protein product [Adineta steineri]|uniref:acylglycerol lipase n=1 Tax=Adineta steineri TaxID=433720 RepID=A0A813VZI5_9BILA|nr:unnamed protein product [Adineta steineri]CAF3988968.1 unnamed protein product [Adineta steineri]